MLSIVVPCYNEQETISLFVDEIEKIRSKIDKQIEIIFINDGSSDDTLNVIKEMYNKYPKDIKYISFSRNFGKEAALYAGLQKAQGDLIRAY